MKWAKVTASPAGPTKGNPCSKLQDRNDQLCYKMFGSQAELDKQMVCNENLWAQYEFEYDFSCEEREANRELQRKSPEKFEQLIEKITNEKFLQFQDRYSNFAGGFLEFYDRIVRRKNTDHTVYFKWAKLGKGREKNLYGLKIYLFPAPLRYKAHVQSSNGAARMEFMKNEQDHTTSDSADDLTTDPPPPPPPPPPTMH